MKKLFALVAGAALVASSAFADVSVGVSGRGVANMFSKSSYDNDYDNDSVQVAASTNAELKNALNENTKDGSHSFVAEAAAHFLNDFNFSAETEDKKLGFNLDFEYYTGSNKVVGDELDEIAISEIKLVLPDQAKAWWQPTDWFLAQIGMIEVDDLRGSVGDWGVGRRDIGSLDEDDIFDRFYPQAGVAISLYPVEGLFVGVTFDTDNVEGNTMAYAENFYKGLNIGVGYTIDDKFQLKFAYFGDQEAAKTSDPDEFDDDDYNGKLEFGFDWNVNEDNVLEVGVKVPLWSDDDTRKAHNIITDPKDYAVQVVAGFAGANDNLSYKAHAKFASLSGTNKDDDLDFYPELALDGGLEVALDNFTLGGTVLYDGIFNTIGAGDITKNTFGIEAYIKKDVAADCFVFGGIADKFSVLDIEDTVKHTENTFYIPVGIEFAF